MDIINPTHSSLLPEEQEESMAAAAAAAASSTSTKTRRSDELLEFLVADQPPHLHLNTRVMNAVSTNEVLSDDGGEYNPYESKSPYSSSIEPKNPFDSCSDSYNDNNMAAESAFDEMVMRANYDRFHQYHEEYGIDGGGEDSGGVEAINPFDRYSQDDEQVRCAAATIDAANNDPMLMDTLQDLFDSSSITLSQRSTTSSMEAFDTRTPGTTPMAAPVEATAFDEQHSPSADDCDQVSSVSSSSTTATDSKQSNKKHLVVIKRLIGNPFVVNLILYSIGRVARKYKSSSNSNGNDHEQENFLTSLLMIVGLPLLQIVMRKLSHFVASAFHSAIGHGEDHHNNDNKLENDEQQLQQKELF